MQAELNVSMGEQSVRTTHLIKFFESLKIIISRTLDSNGDSASQIKPSLSGGESASQLEPGINSAKETNRVHNSNLLSRMKVFAS